LQLPETRVALSDFILGNRETIMAEWEAFARTCAPASGSMDITALRDHASEMLSVIAADLDTPQSPLEQSEKSKGNAPVESGKTAAERHGADRAESGFTTEQMVSEYRALRASVIRLWMKTKDEMTRPDADELTRFNEAIDQALAESVVRYTQDLNQSKEMFLAILGHDLRTPIGAVMMSSEFMLDTGELAEPHLTLTSRIASSAKRMNQMVGALLDFTRSRLGGGIPIERAPMNMGKLAHDVVNEISAAYPTRTVEVDARASLTGQWDCARMSQVLSNLTVNAIEHGSPTAPVVVTVKGDDTEVTIAVRNVGPQIPVDQLNGIFNPMKQRQAKATSRASGRAENLGLGLYIAERIVSAHRGRIDVDSSAEATTFTVRLPRNG
jgi:signal transduction histidine kinase